MKNNIKSNLERELRQGYEFVTNCDVLQIYGKGCERFLYDPITDIIYTRYKSGRDEKENTQMFKVQAEKIN